MARLRSRVLDLERDDVFYGTYCSDHISVGVHAIVAWAILSLLIHLAAGYPRAAAVCAVLYGAYCSFLDREAPLGFLCWAANGVLAARLGFATGREVLYTFAGCEPRLGFRAATTPPPSVHTSAGRASTVASTLRNSN